MKQNSIHFFKKFLDTFFTSHLLTNHQSFTYFKRIAAPEDKPAVDKSCDFVYPLVDDVMIVANDDIIYGVVS